MFPADLMLSHASKFWMGCCTVEGLKGGLFKMLVYSQKQCHI